MGKNRSPSKQQGLQKNERWKPYVRWNRETDEWISKAIRVDQDGDEEMEEVEVKIEMTKKELDVISRIVAYLYHDKKDEYEEVASDMRKKHIYADLRSINIWLDNQYRQLEDKNEQSKQEKRKYL